MGAYPTSEQDKIREIDRLRTRIDVLEAAVARAADDLEAVGYPQTAAAVRGVLPIEDRW